MSDQSRVQTKKKGGLIGTRKALLQLYGRRRRLFSRSNIRASAMRSLERGGHPTVHHDNKREGESIERQQERGRRCVAGRDRRGN